MRRDGTLDKFDVKPYHVKTELWDRINGPDGLWFVSRYLIGNNRLLKTIHRPALMQLQQWVATPDCLFAYRDPRMSGKTDGFTIALPFWAWAAKPIKGSPIQGVNTCIAVVAPKKDIASYIFVANVDRRYRQCEAYRDLVDWVQPDPKFWSLKNGLLIQRTLAHGLPSLLPLGMESVSTSLHPPILICDDPIHEQNYRSPTEVRRVRSWVEHSHSLTGPIHGVRGFIGNHWAVGDVQDLFHPERDDCPSEYKHVKVWERGITGCDSCVDGREPGHYGNHDKEVYPVALGQLEMNEHAEDPSTPDIPEPPEYIEEVRHQKPTFIFLTQHENILTDPANLYFEKRWIKHWNWHYTPDGAQAIKIGADPKLAQEAIKEGDDSFINESTRGGLSQILPISLFDMYMLVDPAPSEEGSISRSKFAYSLVACEKNGPNEFLIQEYARNAPEHVHINSMLDTYITWRPYIRKWGIESIGYQATVKDALLTAARNREIHTLRESEIENLSRLRSEGQQIDRIKYAFIPVLESGHFYIHPTHRIFRAEYDVFGLPNTKHDLLDSISNLNRVRGPKRGSKGNARQAVTRARNRLLSTGTTGY